MHELGFVPLNQTSLSGGVVKPTVDCKEEFNLASSCLEWLMDFYSLLQGRGSRAGGEDERGRESLGGLKLKPGIYFFFPSPSLPIVVDLWGPVMAY